MEIFFNDFFLSKAQNIDLVHFVEEHSDLNKALPVFFVAGRKECLDKYSTVPPVQYAVCHLHSF